MVDSTSLFLHVLAATGIVGGGLAQIMAGQRVRTATTAGRLRDWVGFTRLAGLVVLGSAVVSLLTGGHLAGAVWTTEESSGFSHPFITLGVVALLLLAPIGPMVGGARLRRLVADAPADDNAPLDRTLHTRATAASLWGPVHSLLGVAVGLVAVMTYKPSWAVTGAVLLVTFALGWASGVAAARGAEGAGAGST